MEEDDDNDYEYHLNDPGEIKQQIKNYQLKSKIITGLIIFLIILFLGVFGFFIYYFIIRKSPDDNKDNNNQPNSNTNPNSNKVFNFSSLFNVTYGVEGNKIENTFKVNGSNYNNQSFGIINNGKDYKRNPDRNTYDLFIPEGLDKNKYNKILLFIHGGFYIIGDKTQLKPICQKLAKQGYITASMDYSLLNNTNYDSSIFKILDEIASAIKSIKKTLKEKGFNETKLELAIGGASSGSQTALLYAYLYKASPLPIKFAINLVGPVTLEPGNGLQIKDLSNPLDNIEEGTIKKAIEEKTVVNITGEGGGIADPLGFMFIFLGYKPAEIAEITKNDSDKGKRMQEVYMKFQLTFPIAYPDKNPVPTLCLYGGKDTIIGIKHYSLLKSKFANKSRIDIAYNKNLTHDFYIEGNPDSEKCFLDLKAKLLDFSNKYFSKNK